MFKVIGTDGKEYGPVPAEEIKSWIAQRRLNAQSRIREEDATEWKSLRDFPEFGAAFADGAAPPFATSLEPPSKLSGLALASLILGVLGLVTLGLAAIPGLILGIIALMKIQKSQARLSGTGVAIAGICISGVMLLMLPIMAAMLLPALAKAKSKSQQIMCMNQVKQLNLALIMYATDNKNQLPTADQWCDLTKVYVGNSTTVYHCPSEPPGRCSYTLNAAVTNQTQVKNPARTVLVFSSSEGWNRAGGLGMAASHQHGRQFITVGFVDGHVEVTRSDRLKTFIWEP